MFKILTREKRKFPFELPVGICKRGDMIAARTHTHTQRASPFLGETKIIKRRGSGEGEEAEWRGGRERVGECIYP